MFRTDQQVYKFKLFGANSHLIFLALPDVLNIIYYKIVCFCITC